MMKKLFKKINILLMSISILSFVSCGKSSTATTSSSSSFPSASVQCGSEACVK